MRRSTAQNRRFSWYGGTAARLWGVERMAWLLRLSSLQRCATARPPIPALMPSPYLPSLRTALLTVASFAVAFAVASPARAQTTFDFANLASTVPTSGAAGNPCTSGDRCSTRGGSLSFAKGGIAVSAFGFFNNVLANGMVVQDNGGGLGVYSQFGPTNVPTNPGDDNVTMNESLKLSFSNAVSISTLGMRDANHRATGWLTGSQFEYRVDGGAWETGALPANTGIFALNKTGTDFEFRYASNGGGQFYIGGATVTTATVPEPSSVLLMASAVVGLLVVARRRVA